MYENFTGNKISRKVLITEIDDLLVDLTDVGFEWYFPSFSFEYKHILISLHNKNEEDFKVDDTMIDCVNTLVDWMVEKYGINSVSYKLSLCSGSDIVTKEFSEDEFGLAVFEITIILNL
jgi:hypothetical protein